MPKGILGRRRLTNIGPLVEDDSFYYHAAPEEVSEDIMEHGITPTDAGECPSGRGIHIFDEKDRAELWGQIKSNGEYSEPKPYRIWKVVIPMGRELVSDEFVGIDFPGAYIICGDEPVDSELVGKTDTLIQPEGKTKQHSEPVDPYKTEEERW